MPKERKKGRKEERKERKEGRKEEGRMIERKKERNYTKEHHKLLKASDKEKLLKYPEEKPRSTGNKDEDIGRFLVYNSASQNIVKQHL